MFVERVRPTDRFEILRRIGEGGMGVVYEAYDRKRETRVALKTLPHLSPSGVHRLKQEFRALCDVLHPNLVALHELFGDADEWFFTMDLVTGVPFLEYVQRRPLAAEEHKTATSAVGEQATAEVGARRARRPASFEEKALREALRQLATGVHAIHAAGKLHRDLKPSNVLVTDEPRVLILDFGLASEAAIAGADQTLEDSISGTPAYMSPEQARGDNTTEASDWYSVGVMLYEALTGVQPFSGTIRGIFAAKQTMDARPPGVLTEGIPPDLEQLCIDLLARRPEDRPGAAEILARVGASEASAPRHSIPLRSFTGSSAATGTAVPLVGRDAELELLTAAFDRTRDGRPVAVFLEGDSGMGKSTLVEHFLQRMRNAGEAVVLSGRCYERESVPYKAFDGIIDSLSRHLRRLSLVDATALLPRDVFALEKLFPVLGRVDAIAQAPSRQIPDASELRRRAFFAFGELLVRVRDRRPLILHIDDAQWVDDDSTVLLRYMLSHRSPVATLLIISCRRATAQLEDLHRLAVGNGRIEVRDLTLGALTPDGAQELALALLDRDDERVAEVARNIALESSGSPFFVGELVRHAIRNPSARNSVVSPTLSEALMARIAELPLAAQYVLRTVAVAGQPLPPDLVLAASGLGQEGYGILERLRSEQLLHGGSGPTKRTVECYHDRIRETVTASLDGEAVRAAHARLADALASKRDPDPELLAEHLERAGDVKQAAQYAAVAAERAVSALAFRRAARLYRQVLAYGRVTDSERGELMRKLADAHAHAGQGKEAADAYLRAAQRASARVRRELKRNAAEQLMITGRVAEGKALLGEVLQEFGLRLPRSPSHAAASLLASRTRLKLRGLHFTERHASAVPRRELEKLDAMRSAMRLSLSDSFLVADFATRGLIHALDVGEPQRLAGALAMEAVYRGFAGPGTEAQTGELLALAGALTDRTAEPRIWAQVELVHGVVALSRGHWQRARGHIQSAVATWRDRCTGVVGDIAGAAPHGQTCAFFLGDIGSLARSTPELLEETRRREDVRIEAMLLAYGVTGLLSGGDVAQARAELQEAKRRRQPVARLQAPDAALIQGECFHALYCDEPSRALEIVLEAWPAIRRAMLLRFQVFEATIRYLAGGAALVAASRPGGEGALRHARASIRGLGRSRMPHAPAFRDVLAAGLALHRGDQALARRRLRAAELLFDACDMSAHAAAASRRLGEILGGEAGADRVRAADETLAVRGVNEPDRFIEMLVPGCRRRV